MTYIRRQVQSLSRSLSSFAEWVTVENRAGVADTLRSVT